MRSRKHAAVAALLGLTLVLGGCFGPQKPPVPKVSGPAFPAGCGPRGASRPASVPSVPLSAGRPLPIYGGPILGRGLAAGGSTLVAAAAGQLYASHNAGARWQSLALPAGSGTLDPVALSPGGHWLAATDRNDLYLLHDPGSDRARAWLQHKVTDLAAVAFYADNGVVGLGGKPATGAKGQTLVYFGALDAKGRLSVWNDTLPLPLGHGQGLAITRGIGVVALGQAQGPARLFTLLLTAARYVDLPEPPSDATSPVYALAAGPDGTLYLATAGGLFMLPAAGTAWIHVPWPQGAAKTHVYLLATAHHLYLAADDTAGQGGLWSAAPTVEAWTRIQTPPGFVGRPAAAGGALWVPTAVGPARIGTGGGAQVRAQGIAAPVAFVASAPWQPERVLAGWGTHLYISDDGGQTWTRRQPPVHAGETIAHLAWTPDGRCLTLIVRGLSGSSPPRAYLSGDAGHTWWQFAAIGGGRIAAVTESPPGSGVWWLAEGKAGLYRSEPGHATWIRVDLPAAAGTPAHLAPAASGVWFSDPVNGAWRVKRPPAPTGLAAWWARITGKPAPGLAATRVWGAGVSLSGRLQTDPYATAVVYSGLRRSVDAGATWGVAEPGPHGVLPLGAAIRALTFGPEQPGAVILTPGELVRDDGRTWVPIWSPPGPHDHLTGVAPAGPGRFYAAVSHLGLVVVAGAATTWHAPVPPPGHGDWTVLAAGMPAAHEVAAPSDSRTIYRWTREGSLSLSRDGGRKFSALPAIALAGGKRCCTAAGAAGPRIVAAALAVSRTDPQRLYLGLALTRPGSRPTGLGLWTSADGGRTWSRTDLPATVSVGQIVTVPGSARTLYAVGRAEAVGTSGGLWRSTDGGVHWARVPAVPQPVYGVAAPRAGEILAGGAGVIWRSVDGGRTFSRLAVAVPIWRQPGPQHRGLAVTAVLRATGGTLYAGTGYGVAASRDQGRTWQVISEPVGDPAVLAGGLSQRAGGALVVASDQGEFLYRPPGR